MLSHLSIKNYALIEDIEIGLEKGLTTITGETGAGKSIILGAISLLAGNRADRSMLKSDAKKCVIEASFIIGHLNLKSIFEEFNLEYSDESIIRREFSTDGKSRVFINDSPAALLHLKEVMNRMLDVHSQHENLELNNKVFQLEAIDVMAENKKYLEEHRRNYIEYLESKKELERLTADSKSLRDSTDLLAHELNELNDANLSDGEQEELEQELDTLNHAEEIKLNFQGIEHLFSENESNPVGVIKELQGIIRKTKGHFPGMENISERMDSLLIELEDIRNELERFSERFSYDPERLQIVQDRISLIYRLQQKFRLNTVKELIDKKEALREELTDIESLDERLNLAQKKNTEALKKSMASADMLNKRRNAVLAEMEKSITSSLQQLGMANSVLKIDIQKKEPDFTGGDEVEFLFSANKGIDARPISKVASGGELSRLMLAIKAMLTSKTELPTIIFDEIDTGISGLIAEKMGRIILEMCKSTQVLAITHLPQIAAMGQRHLVVYKDDSGSSSKTKIKEIKGQERVEEIARLLSGEEISTEALNNAKVLLSAAG